MEYTKEEFRELLINSGLNDDDLAGLLKVNRPTVDRWKRGVTSPHPIAIESAIKAVQKRIS